MRVYLLSFLFFVAAAAQDAVDDSLDSEPDLFIYDDEKNLVRLEYNKSDLEEDWKFEGNLEEDDVKFFLNSRDSQTDQELFINDEETLANSFYKPERETKFAVHGWLSSKNSVSSLVKALLKRGDFNVIAVDWSKLTQAEERKYFTCAAKVPKVAERVAEMMDFLVRNGMDLNVTTLVGHSLGAHVAGLSANFCKGTVNYVVGLDPALPAFGNKGPGRRISTEDAKYVEIIHSNAAELGFKKAIGKADYFPNGGKKQPGCLESEEPACSHSRSVEYFIESINSEVGFYGRQCPDEVSEASCNGKLGKMGGLKRCLREEGSYYVPTNEKEPFAIGKLSPRS